MHNPLSDIRQFSPTMTMTQLQKFFEKKGLVVTRAMIQNYVRDGLLPPPVGKRFYTHKHIAALVLVDRLKTVFDMPSIRAVLVPYMDNEGVPLEIYEDLMGKVEAVTGGWLAAQAGLLERDGALLLMACTAELKAVSLG